MTDRQPFSYAVLRYRHDPLAGELVNVGVLLFAPKSGRLEAKFRHTYGRLSKLYPDIDGQALTATLRRAETRVRDLTDDAKGLFSSDRNVSYFAKLTIDDPAGSFVWSEVKSGISKNLEDEIDKLYRRFVSRFDSISASGKSDADVWKPVRDLLAERQIASLLERKTISSTHNEVEFDHAWKNGVWHCFQPLSFDLKDRESINNKAARWVGHIVGISDGPEDFQTYFIVGEPSDKNLKPAFERAVSFLEEIPAKRRPRVVRSDEIDDFVSSISVDVANHHGHR